jgi:prepilin-type N-terminal cleavage/methylation domain-containing protein
MNDERQATDEKRWPVNSAFIIQRSSLRLRGFTLIELLVVLIIMAILASVTLRAMDITRERTNYEKTMASLQRLSIAIVGDPMLIAEGRRTDFGFVGDLGRLPTSLDELASNINGDSAWNGPYARIPFVGDSLSFKTDAWGNEFQYLEEQGEVVSQGNGSSPITYSIADDTTFLFWNQVSGTITDNQGDVPGAQAPTIRVSIWVTDPQTGLPARYDTVPGPDGHYVFDPADFRIPVGNHEMLVVLGAGGGESLTKWVTVTPRVGAIVDFRTGTPLGGSLRLINFSVTASGDASQNVAFDVVNTGNDTISIDSVGFFQSDSTILCSDLLLNSQEVWYWQTGGGLAGDNTPAMSFVATPESVFGSARMHVELDTFKNASDSVVSVVGRQLQLKFSDGSLISFSVP